MEFVFFILEFGIKNSVFFEGDKFRIVVLWNEEEGVECNFLEFSCFLIEYKCLEKIGIVDLDWVLDKKFGFFNVLD